MPDRTIVTLSSIPPRFDALGPTLDSLLAQDHPPDEIQLWIPHAYRRFADWDGRLPAVPEGVAILRPEADLGPATKILPALQRHAGEAVNVVLCDDDRAYRSDWLGWLQRVSAERPGHCIVTHGRHLPGYLGRPSRRVDRLPRANMVPGATTLSYGLNEFLRILRRQPLKRSSGYADLVYGYCGVLMRPDYMPPEVFDIPPLLWAHDDIWLSGHLERRGVPIWADARIPMPIERREVMEVAALLDATIEDHDRRALDGASIEYFRRTYGIWQPAGVERLLARLRPIARQLVGRI